MERDGVRASGYFSRLYELGYGQDSPLYDLIVAFGFLPMGGEPACRRLFAGWCDVTAGARVASLCCGTGRNERFILDAVPDARIVGIDLGPGQLARARRKNPGGRVDYRLGDASNTGLPGAHFDLVLICLALHEMPRSLRLRVLREAARLCRRDGRVVAIEHARPRGRLSRFFQWLWFFFWLPGNPEHHTSRDMQRHGLANEFVDSGLEVIERRFTRPDWIEGVIGKPVAGVSRPAPSSRERTSPPEAPD